LAFGIVALVGATLSDRRVPLPFTLASGISLDAPVRAFAPVLSCMLVGYALSFQQYPEERAAVRAVAGLDAALLVAYSAILALPALVWLPSGDAVSALAMARNGIFAVWVVVIGAHIVGTRLSVAAVTLGVLMTPPLLPLRYRDDPPPFVVTMARPESIGAWLVVGGVMVVGMTVVAKRGLPPPP